MLGFAAGRTQPVMTRPTLLLWILATLLAPAASRADQMFRCGVHLVSAGDSEASVRDWCGPPTTAERTNLSRMFRGVRTSGTVDEWTYDRGPTQFVRILTFDAPTDRLLSIRTGNYGR